MVYVEVDEIKKISKMCANFDLCALYVHGYLVRLWLLAYNNVMIQNHHKTKVTQIIAVTVCQM